jgi:hypothetical protein
LLRIGPLEYLRRLGDQFDELAAEFHVRAFGVLVPGQVATQLAPLFLELVPSLSEEVFGDEPVKAIVVEPIQLAASASSVAKPGQSSQLQPSDNAPAATEGGASAFHSGSPLASS